MNGYITGNENDNFTFIVGKGNSIIYYGIVNEEMVNIFEYFRVIDRIESDQAPLKMSAVKEEERSRSDKIKKKKGDK